MPILCAEYSTGIKSCHPHKARHEIGNAIDYFLFRDKEKKARSD